MTTPSGHAIHWPTPAGWRVRVGCWQGDLDGLDALIHGDDPWPEAQGAEKDRRRPYLEAFIAAARHHETDKAAYIEELAKKWAPETVAAEAK